MFTPRRAVSAAAAILCVVTVNTEEAGQEAEWYPWDHDDGESPLPWLSLVGICVLMTIFISYLPCGIDAHTTPHLHC